ncbi:MAG: hypothetical protein ACTHY4_08145 [Flavobacteriaceae bacterium]
MKKLLSLTVLFAIFSFSSIAKGQPELTSTQKTCFEGAREVAIILDGEINLGNIQLVNDLTSACEEGLITFN